MNREIQRRKIQRFIKGKGRNDLDAFCIYQWIDRCHYEGWWNLAISLGTSIPPNSLGQDYQKRLEFLLSECGNNLKSLKKEFIKIRNPESETEFMLPRSFWESCEELGLSIRGKSKRGLRFELAGKKILFIKNIDLIGCVISFYKMDSEKLTSWLNSHGFGHFIQGIVGRKAGGNVGIAKLRIAWQDAELLMPSIIAELEKDSTILMAMFFEAIGKVKNGTWGQYLDYVKKNSSIRVSDIAMEKVRKVLIGVASGLEGYDQFVKRLEAD